MLGAGEREQLLEAFNDTLVDYPAEQTVIDLIEEQVRRSPESVAVVYEGQELTYGELDARSNQLGNYLRGLGVKEENLVPICVERGFEMIIGTLGILKAGGAYVPIDPEYPQDRIQFMLEDIGGDILVTSGECRSKVATAAAAIADCELIDLGDWLEIGKKGTGAVGRSLRPEHLAYMIYTSGSTGRPKGVLVEHRSLVNRLRWAQGYFGLGTAEVVLQKTTYSFDVSIGELLGPLLSGSALVFARPGGHKDSRYIKDIIEERGITMVHFVPSMLEVFLQEVEPGDCGSLRRVLCSGEALRADQVRLFRERLGQGVELHNLYGPTEAAIEVTYWRAPEGEVREVPIGRPLWNTQLYILDEHSGLCPVGVPGELWIGGVQVARGYWKRPELTGEKFVANPYGPGRLYRTGDICRWLEDGNIAYMGRRDDQVKVRGYRIELGEIETVLGGYPGLKHAVVMVREDGQGQKRLLGYVVTEGGMDREGMERYVAGKLPEYMVPRQWVELAELPLTGSGKVDRKALPEPEGSGMLQQDYVAPRNEVEEVLVKIWQEVLEVDRVGIHDDFFELGGHSLLMIRVISAVRKSLSVEMVIGDLFDHPTIAELGEKLSGEAAAFGLPVLEAGMRPERIPLSYGQERLWFIDRLEGSVQYHLPLVLRLKGLLDDNGFGYSLNGVMSRHEVLRTVLREEEGSVYQHILGSEGWELSKRDGRGWTAEELALYIRAWVNAPFDLSADHLLRAELIGLKEDEHILVVVMHHIVSDGWSIPILVREFNELYRSWKEGRAALLPVLEVQYADYAIWQRSYLGGEAGERQLAYWKEQLKDIPVLELPVDYARPAVQSIRGSRRRVWLEASEVEGLRSLSQREGVTMYLTLLSAFKVLLHRYSGQEDISVGSPVTNRRQKEVEGLVGFFVNTLVMRSDLGGDPTFRELLGRVKATVLSAYEHQDLPFERVVDEVVRDRDRSRSPLFQVMFAQLNTDNVPGLSMEGLSWSSEDYAVDTSKFDVTCYIEESSAGVRLEIEYCTDLFSQETIDRMIGHYKELLRSVVANAGVRIGELGMLAAGEELQLLEAFNDTKADYPVEKTVVDLIEEQVRRKPKAVAVIFEGEELTYGELDRRSNQLGHYLRGLGVKEESLVPICVERGFEMMVGILGILKAGGAYVPIDPEYPLERIQFILEDIGGDILLTSGECRSKVETAAAGRIVVEINKGWTDAEQPNAPVGRWLRPEHLAYMIYTSGSTGRPKGVLVEHGSLVNRLRWAQGYFGLEAEDMVLQKTTYCFDVSVWELLWPLLSGSVLVFARPGGHKDSRYIKDIIGNHGITTVHFVPSMLEVFLQEVRPGDCESLRRVLCSGEALRADQVRLFRERLGERVQLYNLYGPTEAAIDVTYWRAPQGEVKEVPIGRPVWNTRLYILDEHSGLCPVGVPGELWIGGVQVARGYWKRPELTAEKFVADPYGPGRLYRTGDLCRWLEDGNIAYMGRRDDQVKLRGYRIELGEIDTVLGEYPGIRQAVVVVREDGHGQKRLVGYVVTEGGMDKEGMERFLVGRLPEYMVPRQWVELAEVPLTGSGKVNRKALPEPDGSGMLQQDYVAPRNEVEEVLVKIWQELLEVGRIGIYDNFFALGGDSIMTIQLVNRAQREGLRLEVRDVFSHQTIESLSTMIAEGEGRLAEVDQGMAVGEVGLTPVQQWFFELSRGKDYNHYNQSVLLRMDGSIGMESLSQGLALLMLRHDSLRFVYRKEDGKWRQSYGESRLSLIEDDLCTVDSDKVAEQLELRSGQYQRSLNIESGEVARFVWYRLPEGNGGNRLLIILHHLVVDGVSWRILLEDLQALLEGRSLGKKGISYGIWYNGLERYSHSRRLLDQIPYWSRVIKAAQLEERDREVYSRDLRTVRVVLAVDKTRRLLHSTTMGYRTDINDLLLSALAKTLCEWIGKDRVVIGLEGHGRETVVDGQDTNATMGWFTSLYPVLLELEPGADYASVIKGVKEQLRRIPDRGIGYGVLRYINKEETLKGGDPWEVLFNYLGRLDNVVKEEGILGVASESVGEVVSGDRPVGYKMMLNSYVSGGALVVDWNYSTRHYEEENIRSLGESYMKVMEELIAESERAAQEGIGYTPSDFHLGGEIGYRELDLFLDQPLNGRGRRREEIEGLYRLSGTQEGILFHSLYEEGTGTYIIQFECTLSGLDEDLLCRSWSEVMRRHTILRSGFYYNELSVPVQCVYRSVELEMEVMDWRGKSETEQELLWRAYKSGDRVRGFDMGRAPLMRVGLSHLADGNVYRMLWTLHHLVSDGWSLPVMLEELQTIYEQLASGIRLEQLAVDRYEEYIRYLESRDKEEAETYWRSYLSDMTGGTLLPFTTSTTARNKEKGVYLEEVLLVSDELVQKVEAYARRHWLTVNTIIQGVWSFLLHKYTGKQDVVYGVTVSGRPGHLAEVEKRVGVYINTLPVRMAIDEKQDVLRWLESIQEDQVRSRHYQYTPLSDMQRWAGIKEELFDSLLVFENYPVSKVIAGMEGKGRALNARDAEVHEQNNYLLSIIVSNAEEMRVMFSYNADLLPSYYVRQIRLHFQQVLMQMVGDAGIMIGELELLTAEERDRILEVFNDTAVGFAKDKTVAELIEEQAARTPNAVAVVFEGRELTYGELDRRSDQLGHYLQRQGVKEEMLVPICVERGFDMIIGILGIMKAGGAYVPIDPAYPQERIGYMLEDIGTRYVVTDRAGRAALAVAPHRELIDLSDWLEIGKEWTGAVPRSVGPEHLAYMIYTSGSTGRPKGVLVEHGSLVNFLSGMEREITFNKHNVMFSVTTFTFDIFYLELYLPLTRGGRMILASREEVMDAGRLSAAIERHRPSHMQATPAGWQVLLNGGWENREAVKILVGGEALREGMKKALSSRGEAWNVYGPTETTIWCSIARLSDTEPVTIGRPISNTKIYVVDGQGRPVPVGVPGELWIGGVQVARGYWKRPELTAEKFMADPFTEGGRLYRTGDIGRWLPDGNIEYIGRRDEQVKVRGYRIELGEIETVLSGYPGVRQAVVVVREDGQGQKRLVGYLVTGGEMNKEGMEEYLQETLPEYMVPRQWVELTEMPLTSSGKVDRKALPHPDREAMTREYAPPRNEVEETLTGIWREVLGLERIGIHDNFFELGGDSIMAIQVVSRSRRAGYALQARQLFQYQTIARLSATLERAASGTDIVASEQGMLTGVVGLLPIQRMFLEDDERGRYDHFNQSVLLSVDKGVNEEVFRAAVEELVARHDSWRLRFTKTTEGWQQEYGDGEGMLWTENLQEVAPDELAGRITAVSQGYQQGLSIEKGEVVRIVWIQTPSTERDNRLLVVAHHLVVDGVSWRIVLEDLEQLLKGGSLGSKGSSYRQWGIALEEYGQGKRAQSQLGYWREVLSAGRRLKTDDGQRIKVSQLGVYVVTLPASLTRQLLQEVPRVYHTEINDVLLSALAMAMLEGNGREEVLIGLEGHGREGLGQGLDLSRTVGWFTSFYPVLLKGEGEKGPGTWLKSVKEQLRKVPDKGLGYGVLKYLSRETSLAGEDPWEIVFNYRGQIDEAIRAGGVLSGAPESNGEAVSGEYRVRERLAVNSIISNGELVVQWSYSRLHFAEGVVPQLAEAYIAHLTRLIEHCAGQQPDEQHYTPSDFGLGKEVGYEELDSFLNNEDYELDDIMSF